MSPDGNIYAPEQVTELKEKTPKFAKSLMELTEPERLELSKLNRKDRRKKLHDMRRTKRP